MPSGRWTYFVWPCEQKHYRYFANRFCAMRPLTALVFILAVLTACEPTSTPPAPALSTLPGIAVVATQPTITPTVEGALSPTVTVTVPIGAITPTMPISGSALGPEVSFWAGDQPVPTMFIPN